MRAWRAAGPGVADRHSLGRETLAGVLVSNDGMIAVELEERFEHRPLAPREYADVMLSVDGARRLRDALDAAIRQAGNRRAA